MKEPVVLNKQEKKNEMDTPLTTDVLADDGQTLCRPFEDL